MLNILILVESMMFSTVFFVPKPDQNHRLQR